MALFKLVFSRRYLSIVALIVTYSLFSFAISQAADAPGTKGPIGTTGKTTPGVTGPVKGTTPSKLKSDIIVINAPVKKVSGAKGSTGSTGAQGPQGLQGPQGEEGEEGMVGPQGPEGLQGIQGIQGIQGPVGPQGERGIAGAKGEKGDTGPQGPPGIDGKTIITEGTGGGSKGDDGITPTISVDETVNTGPAAVSVTKSGNDYKFRFTLPSPGTGGNFLGGLKFVTPTPDDTSNFEKCSSGAISGLKWSESTLNFICSAITGGTLTPEQVDTQIAKAISGLQTKISDPSPGTYSGGGCALGTAVRRLTLLSGTLTYECGISSLFVSSGGSDFSKLSVEKETSSSKFEDSEECSSGQAVRGLAFNDDGELSFLCESVGSNGSSSPMPLPTFSFSGSSSVSITTGSPASVSYKESKFSIVIPSGILGSTITLDSNNDVCYETEKVSGLTLVSNVLKVVCDTDETAPISTVTASPTTAGSTPSVSWNSSSKRLTFVIPAGAKGDKGDTGPPGPAGSSIPTGYSAFDVCYDDGEFKILEKRSSSCSGTKYKMLLGSSS